MKIRPHNDYALSGIVLLSAALVLLAIAVIAGILSVRVYRWG